MTSSATAVPSVRTRPPTIAQILVVETALCMTMVEHVQAESVDKRSLLSRLLPRLLDLRLLSHLLPRLLPSQPNRRLAL
jgi:hypothetical protein